MSVVSCPCSGDSPEVAQFPAYGLRSYKVLVLKRTGKAEGNISILTPDGEEKEFKASTRVRNVTHGRYRGYTLAHSAFPYSPLPTNTRLEPGEVYCLMPPAAKPRSPANSAKLSEKGTCAPQKVKIVLTRRQLELLLKNSTQFKSKGIAIRCSRSFNDGVRKWKPSLVTIPEVQKF
ncbi:hypothetical protein Tsubulata_025483 [Turnera subulata]|uniref:Uncharacterized protein n=1 Tax=Turnera subulata TaxID=218843 RepID=A0A9Q0GHJ0_9ROSI|nr:hypothetical protein Tsubulata_025483 [Turnera subulata]